MKVRMKTRYANGSRAIEPDTEADLPDNEARDLIDKGYAVRVGQDPSLGEKPAAKKKTTSKKPDPVKTESDPAKTDPPGPNPDGATGDNTPGPDGDGDADPPDGE